MKNQKGVSMITLIITIIVIIILAAIAFVASGDTINSAQFSTFTQEFGDYAVNFTTDPMAKLQEKLGLSGKTMTEAQKIYLSARQGLVEADVTGVIVPAGVNFTNNLAYTENDVTTALANLVNASGQVVTTEYWGAKVTADETASDDNSIACYQIVDSQMSGYKDNHKFYGDNLGAETHWVTEKGFVFTLPGYQRTVEGEPRMYISPEVYYVVDTNFSNVINGSESKAIKSHEAEGVATSAKGTVSTNAVGATKVN